MVWIWSFSREFTEFGAVNFGFDPPTGVRGANHMAVEPIGVQTRAIFKSKYSIRRFQKLHAPPTSTVITVDDMWRQIILKFVPSDRVQFIPARIIARGEECNDFSVMIPFDQVTSVDKEKTEFRRVLKNEHRTHIFSVKKLVLLPDCLGPLHLARDKEMNTLVLISDELKEALSATGQDSPFYSVDQYNEQHTWI